MQALEHSLAPRTLLVQAAAGPEEGHIPDLAAWRAAVKVPQLQAVPLPPLSCRHRRGRVGHEVPAVPAEPQQHAAAQLLAGPVQRILYVRLQPLRHLWCSARGRAVGLG